MPFHFYCPQGHLLEGHESQMGQQSQCPICGSVFLMPFPQGMAPPGFAPVYNPPPGYAPQPGYGQGMNYGQPAAGYDQSAAGYQQPVYPGMPNAGIAPAASEQAFPNLAAGEGTAAAGFPNLATDRPHSAASRWAGEPPAAAPASAEPAVAPSAGPSAADGAAGSATGATTEKGEPAEPSKPEPPRIVTIPCPQGHELQTPMDMVNQDVLCPICGVQFHLRYEDSLEFQAEQAERRQRNAERMNALALRWAIGVAVVVVLGIISMIVYLAVRS
jgi:hypothetical protein